MANPHVSSSEAGFIAQKYIDMGNLAKLEEVLKKIVTIVPDQPEAWYDIAELDAMLGKPEESIQNLSKSLDLSAQRIKSNPTAHDLMVEVRKDSHFNPVRNRPDFQKIVPPN
jgi:tetratricopeptide (TPR) repeat protein